MNNITRINIEKVCGDLNDNSIRKYPDDNYYIYKNPK